MVKNGLLALIIHVIVGVCAFVIFTFLINISGIVFKDNETAYHILSKLIAVLIFIGCILAYIILGRNLFRNNSNIQSISVWIVSIIGISLWVLSYSLSNSVIKDISQNINWAIYCLYNAYSFPILVAFNLENPYSLIVYAIIPSILLWFGFRLRLHKESKAD